MLNSKQPTDAGFSLVEIVVVVLVVGVLSAIATPAWLGFNQRQQVNKANDAILSALQQAQQEAKKSKRNYSVSFKVDGNVSKISVAPADSTSPQWKTIGQDIGIPSGQVLVYTNLNATTANKKASDNISYNTPGSGTITFDYMGSLGLSSSNIPLKVAVATPSSAGNLKRCVVIETLIGGMRTAKDEQCDS